MIEDKLSAQIDNLIEWKLKQPKVKPETRQIIYDAALAREAARQKHREQRARLIESNPLFDFKCGCDVVDIFAPKIYGHYPHCFKKKLEAMPEEKRKEIESALKGIFNPEDMREKIKAFQKQMRECCNR